MSPVPTLDRARLTLPGTALTELLARRGLAPGPAGAVSAALALGLVNAAAGMVRDDYVSAASLDTAMRLGAGMSRGPLRLLADVGAGLACAGLTELGELTGSPRYAPDPLLRRLACLPGGPGPAAVSPLPGRTVPPDLPRPVYLAGVIGSGTMATGIAGALLSSGLPVTLVARSAERGRAAAQSARLAAGVPESGRPPGCRVSTDLADLSACDLVIEAVAESLAVKQELFARLDHVTRPGALLATTTSSLPVAACAAATSRPADVLGLHFFNPVAAMRLIEVVRAADTAPVTVATADALARRLGRYPVHCADQAGFVVNALLFPYVNDALRLLGDRLAPAADIDAAVRTGWGFRIGPFRLLELVGADLALVIQRRLHAGRGDPGLAPSILLRRLAASGERGRGLRGLLQRAGRED
jgi:3-hydroxybutyryl-CoA dehydrogenase